jgi:CheY-like chemotaxis protein
MANVLVVDDEILVGDLMAAVLEDEGHRVLRAYDGEEALNIARNEHPDLIISDIMMPAMDGIDLLNAVRVDASLSKTPVLLMSAMVAVRNLSALPPHDFLAKPFQVEDLEDKVKLLLDQ